MFDFLKNKKSDNEPMDSEEIQSSPKPVKSAKLSKPVEEKPTEFGQGRKLAGTVVSNKMQKTVVVEIGHLRSHSKYMKYTKISRKLKAHDETNQYQVGDKVVIQETRPMSKDKHWQVISRV